MGKSVKLTMMLCVLMLFTGSANADWTIYRQADLLNKDRHKLRIGLSSANQILRVWFILHLPQEGAFASKMPLYRIDGNLVRDLHNVESLTTNKEKDRWIYWTLASVQDGINEELLEWINGKSVVFQYYLPGGRIKETTFLLQGIQQIIDEMMSLQEGKK